MKITFEDKTYIEVVKSINPNKIIITITAKNQENALNVIANSVEITQEQFEQLIKL